MRKIERPYRVTTVKANDRYEVGRIGQAEGPRKIATAVNYMKSWAMSTGGDIDDDSSQDDGCDPEDEVVSRNGRGLGRDAPAQICDAV